MMTALFALIAGFLTIAAPCTLPVLPILFGGSIGQTGRLRPVFIALGFVTSFAAAVLVFSAITEVLGVDQGTLRTGAAALLVVFGLLMLWPRSMEWLGARGSGVVNLWHRPLLPTWTGNAGGFVLGTTLGLVWTPCAGPILASILTVIATSTDARWGAFLLFVYAVGAAVPMLAIAYGGQIVTTRTRRLARISHRLQQGFGVLIVLFAVSMFYEYDALITAWFSRLYPGGRVGL